MQLDWPTTALVVIDLQGWVATRNHTPNPAEQVVANAAQLAAAFRRQQAFVVLVRVSSKDMKDMLRPTLDATPPPMQPQPGWDALLPELDVAETDHIVTKKQWGAFYGTDLDLQLRRRGIRTIVLCGIASGIGVDTTAREAFQHGYDLILITDAMTGLVPGEHEHVCNVIFPRLGRLRQTDDILRLAAPAQP